MGTKRTGFIDNSAYLKVKLVPIFMSFYKKFTNDSAGPYIVEVL